MRASARQFDPRTASRAIMESGRWATTGVTRALWSIHWPTLGMDPRITVLIGAYNHEATLPRAVAAILAQTVEDLELILIDDGSTDRSVEGAESLAAGAPRVRVLPMGKNVGIARSLNAALRDARAAVVAVQDADDWS